jgi:antitoxin VapB
MTIEIHDDAIDGLLAEIIAITDETPTEALRKALEERLARLKRGGRDMSRLLQWLETEVWPNLTPEQRRPLTKEEREELLGYGPDGV